jgi:hypothetical protein
LHLTRIRRPRIIRPTAGGGAVQGWRPRSFERSHSASGPGLARIDLVLTDHALVALERALDAVLELTRLGRQEPNDFVLALRGGNPRPIPEIYFLADGKFMLLHENNIVIAEKLATL